VTARPVVVVTRRLPEPVHEALAREFDARLNPEDRPLTADGLKEAVRSADALLTTVTDKVTAEVLATEPRRAKLVANFGVGFNNIDIEAAKARGIAISNTPDVLTDATADLAVTLLLMTARRTGEGERHLRGGQWTGWRPTHMLGTHVTGKTLGLIGMGRIARAVAQRAHHGFGMKVIFHDPFPPAPDVAKALGAEPRNSLEEVLREAHFVSLHCPATPETRHLMNRERLALMRPEAFLVNTARGDVVDEAALVEALQARRIAGAGLDVYEKEPQVTQALIAMDNVVLLPHLGSATRETRVAMGLRAFENLQLFFSGKPLRDRVV
jgi:lactate dehydrogenase-like 2-hydroxyacid dehydrogenase